MKKKSSSLLTLLLLLPMLALASQFALPAFAMHESTARLIINYKTSDFPAPKQQPYWNTATESNPVNYTFVVTNNAGSTDPIVKVVISWEAEGFKPDKFYYPSLWGAVYEPILKQITFESTDPNNVNIPKGETREFTIRFISLPDAEGMYQFIVSTTDLKKEGDVNYVDSYIDKRPPIVKLVFPSEDAYVFDKGADVWINATVSDDANSPYPSGIREGSGYHGVFAVVENVKYPMNYDSNKGIWYAHFNYPNAPITKDGWNYTYHVEAWDWANNWARDPPKDWKFFWYLTEGITPSPMYGPVGTQVTITGRGFKALSTGKVKFYDHIFNLGTVCSFSTNKYGLFTTTCTIPETPAKIYWFNASDVSGIWATAKFEVIPWITMSPSTGSVETTVTIKGTGFVNSTRIELQYGGTTTDRLDYTATEYTTWDGSMSWWIRTVGKSKLVANPTTSPQGSFEATFVIPESWGGYHPVWVNWKPGLDKYGSIRPNEQIFRVLPRISIDPSKGVSGQYVTLLGDGFSTWEYYQKWTEGITVPEDFQTNPAAHIIYPNLIWDEGETGQSYSRDGTGLVLDFGPNQRYVDESHFTLNAEANMEWFTELYYPMAVDAMGTIIYYDALHNTVGTVGSHFLQVPFLQPGNYEVKVYRFNMHETGMPDHSYSTTESKTVTFTVEKTIVAADMTEIINMLKSLNATIENIDKNVATIKTDVGIIKTDVKDIIQKIVIVNGTVARIETKAGTILGYVDDINWNDIVTIKTNVGTIVGKVQNIDFSTMADGIVTIKTDVGTIKANLATLANQETAKQILDTVQQTPLGINLAAVLSAIAAIASITAVVVVTRRLKVAA